MGKVITFSFDDGRSNNYEASKILNDFGYKGTFHITTGYIDGTWKPSIGWRSAGNPLLVEQILLLKDQGHEISLHGDKHITDKEDFVIAYSKLQQWDVIQKGELVGFSLPNSDADKFVLSDLIQSLKDSPLLYLRHGRNMSSSSLKKNACYALHKISGSDLAYQIFNSNNYNDLNNLDRFSLYSVVVKANDTPCNLINYILSLPDNSYVIFMMHSILDSSDDLYGSDPWCWDKNNFIQICDMLQNQNYIEVKTISETVNLMSKD